MEMYVHVLADMMPHFWNLCFLSYIRNFRPRGKTPLMQTHRFIELPQITGSRRWFYSGPKDRIVWQCDSVIVIPRWVSSRKFLNFLYWHGKLYTSPKT